MSQKRQKRQKPVAAAVDEFLADGDRERVLAAVARSLAEKIDSAAASESSRAAAAVPPLVRRLLDVTAELEGRERVETMDRHVEQVLRPLRRAG
jgi:hypothetical protein